MNRTLLISLLASTAVGGTITAYLANPPVELQPTTPGVQQVGNVNVSGKIIAGSLSASNASPTAQTIVGNATSTSGANYAGLFRTDSSAGTGLRGVATSTTGNANGGTFQTASPSGAGVRGFATSSTGTNFGVYGKAVSTDGFAGYFEGRTQTTGDALFSKICVGNVTFPLARLHIRDDVEESPRGLAYISNGTATIGPGTGRRGLTVVAGGTSSYVLGVSGYAEGGAASISYGLYGVAGGTATNYGVFGICLNGATEYAGYFNGQLYATGANAAVKAFMIDHPLDPENKVLTHSSVESDHRMNLYRGEVRTDTGGFATVTVPSWFDALNTDIQYQLTVIDESNSAAFVQAKVVQRLKSGKFRIRTSSPGTIVNWQVSGKRHDPTAEHYPLEVERLKVDGERGKYYEPKAYGKDESLGMGYVENKRSEQAPARK